MKKNTEDLLKYRICRSIETLRELPDYILSSSQGQYWPEMKSSQTCKEQNRNQVLIAV